VDIEASPEIGYVPRARRQVKRTFELAPGRVKYTKAKAYCPISLHSFMQKNDAKIGEQDYRG
jgi:hypothetical protein